MTRKRNCGFISQIRDKIYNSECDEISYYFCKTSLKDKIRYYDVTINYYNKELSKRTKKDKRYYNNCKVLDYTVEKKKKYEVFYQSHFYDGAEKFYIKEIHNNAY